MSHEQRKILDVLERIERILRARFTIPTGAVIEQIGEEMPTNNTVVAGTSGVFQVTPTPAGTSVPAADTITFAANDPAVTISASPDGDPTKAVVAVSASDTNASFQLACQFTGPDFPTPVDATPITVTIEQPTPPPPTLPTGGTIAQLS